MNLKSLQYGAQISEKYCQGASFFCGAHMHQKSTQGAQNIVHQNFKFLEPCLSSFE